MNQMFSILIIVGGGLGTFLLGMKHLSEELIAKPLFRAIRELSHAA